MQVEIMVAGIIPTVEITGDRSILAQTGHINFIVGLTAIVVVGAVIATIK